VEKYLNKSEDSGVIAYEIGSDFIKVQFKDKNCLYVYNYKSPGKTHVEMMKKKAKEGHGLSTYVSQHVGKQYFSKEYF
jgi:formaldehyde-activating enzyme involved in methanogenesis